MTERKKPGPIPRGRIQFKIMLPQEVIDRIDHERRAIKPPLSQSDFVEKLLRETFKM